MALIACTECAGQVSDKAGACPHCGAPVSNTASPELVAAAPAVIKSKGGSLWKWVLGVPVGGFVLLMLVGSCAGSTPEGKERRASRAAIEQCWKEQERKSRDPSGARIIAQACEKMESDYRSK